MAKPSVALRRHPFYAVALLLAGLSAVAVGLVTSEFWVVFMGVLPVIFAALLMLNPSVVLLDDAVELRNVFGMTQARYEHDGFHSLHVEEDVLYIRRGNQRAAVKRVARSRLHPADWQVMVDVIAAARLYRKRGDG